MALLGEGICFVYGGSIPSRVIQVLGIYWVKQSDYNPLALQDLTRESGVVWSQQAND